MGRALEIKSKSFITCFTLVVCLGSFASSYLSVCLTQVALLLRDKNKLSFEELVWQLSIATSSFNFGSIVGPLLFHKLAHATRNWALTKILAGLDGIGVVLCAPLMLYSLSFHTLMVSRFLIGILMGISTSLVPAVIRLLSPVQLAGKMGTINQLMQTSGVFASSVLGFLCMNLHPEDQLIWRLFLGFPFLLLLIRMLCLSLVYPSDYYDQTQLRQFLQALYVEGE